MERCSATVEGAGRIVAACSADGTAARGLAASDGSLGALYQGTRLVDARLDLSECLLASSHRAGKLETMTPS